MSSPIAFRGFDSDEYRKRIRTLSDGELIREGKKMRWLSADGKIVSTSGGRGTRVLRICQN